MRNAWMHTTHPRPASFPHFCIDASRPTVVLSGPQGPCHWASRISPPPQAMASLAALPQEIPAPGHRTHQLPGPRPFQCAAVTPSLRPSSDVLVPRPMPWQERMRDRPHSTDTHTYTHAAWQHTDSSRVAHTRAHDYLPKPAPNPPNLLVRLPATSSLQGPATKPDAAAHTARHLRWCIGGRDASDSRGGQRLTPWWKGRDPVCVLYG